MSRSDSERLGATRAAAGARRPALLEAFRPDGTLWAWDVGRGDPISSLTSCNPLDKTGMGHAGHGGKNIPSVDRNWGLARMDLASGQVIFGGRDFGKPVL